MSASRRSLIALDALCLVLADVRGGLCPFLVVYVSSVHRWSPSAIGLAMAVMGIAGLVAQTPAGALIDLAKYKRMVIAGALALVSASALCLVVLPTPPVILSAQGLIGTAGAVFEPGIAALSLGLVGHGALAPRTGRNQALDHTGNVAAAALAGFIADSVGYGAVFVLASALCLAGILATAMILGADVDAAQARGAEPAMPHSLEESTFDRELDAPALALTGKGFRIAGIAELMSDGRIIAFVIAVVLFHLANAAMLPLVGQKMTTGTNRGAGGSMAAAIVAAQLVMIPVALLASRLAESWGRKPTFLIGFGVLPIRGLLYNVSADPRYLVAVQLLDGVGAGVFGVVSVLVIADLTRGTGRFNLMQGVVGTATRVGAAVSHLATGIIVQAAGYDAGFLALAAVAAGALYFYACAMPETLERTTRKSEDLEDGRRAASPMPAVPCESWPDPPAR
jgi:predicted MFS family arabinose efflux permease